MDKLSVIDLDSMTFIIASNQFKAGNIDNEEEVKNHVKRFVDTLILRTNADYYSLIYQAKGHENFRKFFYGDYKANRLESPEFINIWRTTITSEYEKMEATAVNVIESDDALALAMHKYQQEYEVTLVHCDKDMYQIPGKHWNLRKSVEEALKIITPKEAAINWAIQMLTGDSTDNILGCANKVDKVWASGAKKGESYRARKGIGLKQAEKLFVDVKHPDEILEIVLYAYKDFFGSNWFDKYTKTNTLITLLQEIPNTFLFSKDKNFKFKLVPNTISTPELLFNN